MSVADIPHIAEWHPSTPQVFELNAKHHLCFYQARTEPFVVLTFFQPQAK
jgi:hypothetical protein